MHRYKWVVRLVIAGGCASDLPVVPGEETTDGESSSSSVETTGIEPACGNGIVEAGETCDEQSQTATCDEDCTPVDCGDELVNESAGEQCDEGGASAFCDADCTVAECGDGVLNATAGEDCDDGGKSAVCDVDCTLAVCGDGLFNELAGEECDANELADGTCEGFAFGSGALACNDVCRYETSGCTPGMPVLDLSFSPVKRFDFSWAAVQGAEYYQVLVSASPGDPYVQIGSDVAGESISMTMPLHFRFEASYVLRACNTAGCTDSAAVDVVGSLVDAVGYVKASSTSSADWFGHSVALSGDGNTLAVGALYEDSVAVDSGAVYVFAWDDVGGWIQQAELKASNAGLEDYFGNVVALSEDGNTLAVSANYEDSNAIGVGGDQDNDDAVDSGAVYVFGRDGAGGWSQQAYVKASNTTGYDLFGTSVALNDDGNTMVVGAMWENSNATGINGNQADVSLGNSGAVYVFVRDGMGAWSQQAYVKASPPTDSWDEFGVRVALNGDGNTLAVAAYREDSGANGINGDQTDNTAPDAGAVYVLVRDGMGIWSHQTYLKASNTTPASQAWFGNSVALSEDGNTLAVGAFREDGNATGINGNEADATAPDAGAVYVFVRNGMGLWLQQAYVKASNTDSSDSFGWSVALSADGNTLVAGAYSEDSNATGIDGDQADDASFDSGAVYVFVRDGMGAWSQQAYVKASNTDSSDQFGWSVALSSDGSTLAVGAYLEESNAAGIGGNQANDSALDSGAVYLY